MTPAPHAGRAERDLEAPDADAFEQAAAVDLQEDDDPSGGAAGLRPVTHDLEAPEADAWEQWAPAPLDDDDRR